MFRLLKQKIYNVLRWSEKYTKTDMVYLAKGGSWLTIGQMASSLSSFLLAIGFANLLPKEIYGGYKYFLSIFAIISTLTLNGLNTSLFRSVSIGKESSIFNIFSKKLKYGFLASLASLLTAGYYFYNNDNTFFTIFLIASFFIPFFNSYILYNSYLTGKKLFKQKTIYNIWSTIISTTVIFITIIFTKNLILLIIIYLAIHTILRLIFYKISLKKYQPNKEIDPEAINYGKHLSLMDIIRTSGGMLGNILLWHYLGAASVAIYTIAIAPINQMSSQLSSIPTLAFPKLAILDLAHFKKSLLSKLTRYYLVIISIVLIYIVIAPFVFNLLFPQYLEAIIYSQLYALVLIFTPQKIISNLLKAKKLKKKLYITYIVIFILRIIILPILLPIWGILGLVISEITINGLSNLLLFYFLYKIKQPISEAQKNSDNYLNEP